MDKWQILRETIEDLALKESVEQDKMEEIKRDYLRDKHKLYGRAYQKILQKMDLIEKKEQEESGRTKKPN